MQLKEILALGVKSRATEITLAENAPVVLLKGHEPLRLNVPPLTEKDYGALLASILDCARDALGRKASSEFQFMVDRLGTFKARVSPGRTVIVLPVAPPEKPGFFRKWFGG